MTSEKCPNCGAGIAPSAARCEYCGTAFTDAPDMTWTRVDRHMPPKDPANPSRSVPVIIIALADGVIWTNKKGVSFNMYNDSYDYAFNNAKTRGTSPYFLIAAYYDFARNKWTNDLYGKRLEKNESSSLISPTHWMHIPPKSSPDWIDTEEKAPPLSRPDDKNSQSIVVLACDKYGDYKQSVITAQYSSLPLPSWGCYELDYGTGDSNSSTEVLLSLHKVKLSHWMPYPAEGPKE